MNYKAVLFDMDGTLINSLDFHAACFQRFFAKYGRVYSLEQMRGMMGETIKVILNNVLPADTHGKALKDLSDFYNTEIDDLVTKIEVFPETGRTLDGLQAAGVPMYLITNSKSEVVGKILSAHNLNYFDGVLGADEDSLDKTGRCRNLLDDIGLSANNALYVGDTYADVRVAEIVGMDSCLVLNSNSWIHKEGICIDSVHATFIIECLDQVLGLL